MSFFRGRWQLVLGIFLVAFVSSAALVLFLNRPVCLSNDRCAVSALLWAVPLTFLLAVLVTWLTGRHQEQRLLRLHQMITRLNQGEQEVGVLPLYDDATGQLINAFNQLVEQGRAQFEQLGSDRERLYSVLNNMSDGVLFTDETGAVEFINPTAARQLDIKAAKAADRPFAEVARHHQLIDLWQQCRQETREQTAMIEMARRDLFLQAVISPLAASGGSGYLIILHDLTRIRRADMARRDLISNVSHEFRTPLASLGALVETLTDGALEDPPTARRFLDRAAVEVDALTQIVEELLTLSRIESGRVPLRLRPTDATSLVLKATERLVPQAERKQIELLVDLPGGVPPVLADESQVSQVLTNLIHNAIKFTPAGGLITLSAEVDAPNIRFSVKDNGDGIPAENLPRIFERFYKADRVRQRSEGGTGLGLAIAKHIIQSHGGEIWAKSKEGRGSTFYFTLPIAT